MQITPLEIAGAWLIEPVQHADDRGVFLESFRWDHVERATGRRFDVRQANTSVTSAGGVRGVHFADVPPSQAKYVTCATGAVLDVVVDIRVGSPTFGRWTGVLLDDVDRRAVLLEEGLGHAFMALEDGSTVTYLCTAPYAPGREHGVHPLDPGLGIEWPSAGRDGSALTVQLSPKDAAAPLLSEARDQGLLPTLDAVTAFRRTVETAPER